jgi:hypothetical protein
MKKCGQGRPGGLGRSFERSMGAVAEVGRHQLEELVGSQVQVEHTELDTGAAVVRSGVQRHDGGDVGP